MLTLPYIAMNNPITIVIPAYNRAATLPRTLLSIERQTLAPARVVLVDNASTDSTLDLMKEWASAQRELDVVVLSESRRGACAARNRGLEAVETDFVMFFDSDDEMLPPHVADFAAEIARRPDCDIFGRDIICVELDGRRRTLYYSAVAAMFNHIFRGSLSTQRMVVRTELVRRVGGWNESLPAWNDYELGARLLLATDKVCKLKGEPTVVTYRQKDSLTGTSFSARHEHWEKSLACIEGHFIAAGWKNLVKWLDARRMVLAAQYQAEAAGADAAAAENAARQSERLRREVLSRSDTPRRMKMIYLHNIYFKRLSWVLARLLFPFT